MIDTFMVLWNRDRGRKGFKLFLACLFISIMLGAAILLAALYLPNLVPLPLPQKENLARDFMKTAATATAQADQVHIVSLRERTRALETTPISGTAQPQATSSAATVSTPANTVHEQQKNQVKPAVAPNPAKHAPQQRRSSSHQPTKQPSKKIVSPPGSSLRPTSSSTQPGTGGGPSPAVTPTSTPTITPSEATAVPTEVTAGADTFTSDSDKQYILDDHLYR